jgi:hypothetical protein
MDNNRISIVKDKYTAWIEKNNKLFLDLVANPYMIDTQHKYLDWIVGAFQRTKVDMLLKDIISLIEKFDGCASQLDRKNLYSYNDIYDLQTSVVAYLNKTEREEAKTLEDEHKEKLLEDDENKEEVFYTYNEFVNLLYQKIIELYPHSFKIKDKFTIDGNYESDSRGEIKLVYSIPYFNTIINIVLHLFDSDSPLTLQTQDMTSSRESKQRTFRLPFPQTAFKNRSLCFNLLNKGEDPALCLKLIEFTVAFFVDSPEFQQIFSVENIYWKGSRQEFDGSTEALLQYIKEKQESGGMATKYDYVVNYLQRSRANVRSFQRRIFADLKKAKVIDIKKMDNGYTFVLGQNYHPFIEGRLKHI